jgi:hypothetical protein
MNMTCAVLLPILKKRVDLSDPKVDVERGPVAFPFACLSTSKNTLDFNWGQLAIMGRSFDSLPREVTWAYFDRRGWTEVNRCEQGARS